MSLKNNIYITCINLIEEKINHLQTLLHDLRTGSANDAKSSAGDKHETAKAMMQMEHEKISRQLHEVLLQKEVLNNAHLILTQNKVVNGSLVKTDKGFFYLTIAIGKITVDGEAVIVLSPQSPLGIKLMGLKIKDKVQINNVHYLIETID